MARYILAGTPGSNKTSILSDRDEKWRCTSIEESTTDVVTCTSMASAFCQLEHVLIGFECHLSHRHVRLITCISRLRGRPHIGMRGVDSHQRRLMRQMELEISRFHEGSLSVVTLAENVHSLYQAADFRSAELTTEFMDLWLPVEMEAEVQREGWDPPDTTVGRDQMTLTVDALARWIATKVGADGDDPT